MSYARTAVTRMTLDMSRLDLQRSETVTLGDTNRRWEVTLINGGAPFRLPPDWTAALTGIKPDGTGLLNGCSVADGKIIYDFAAGKEIATCAGNYPVQFDIWDEVGALVASPKLYVNVLADVRPYEELDSTGQYTLIGDLRGRVEDAEKDIQSNGELGETNAQKIEDAEKNISKNKESLSLLATFVPNAERIILPKAAWTGDKTPYRASLLTARERCHVIIWSSNADSYAWLNINRPTVSTEDGEVVISAEEKPEIDLEFIVMFEPYSVRESDEGTYSAYAVLVGLQDEADRLSLGKRVFAVEEKIKDAELIGGTVSIESNDWDKSTTTITLPLEPDTLTIMWPSDEVSTTLIERNGLYINQSFVDDEKDTVMLLRGRAEDYTGRLTLKYVRVPYVTTTDKNGRPSVQLIGTKFAAASEGGNEGTIVSGAVPCKMITIAADGWSETKNMGLTTWITGGIQLENIRKSNLIRLLAANEQTATDWSAGQVGAEITYNEENKIYSLRVGIIGSKPSTDWQILLETLLVEAAEDEAGGPYINVVPPASDAISKVADHNYNETSHPNLRDQVKDNGVKLEELTKKAIDKTVSDLVNYYTKFQTLTKEEINALVSAIPKFDIEVVSSLPTSNISETTVYLVKSGADSSNLYTEYIRANGAWERLGTQTVDLTGYATEAWVNELISAYVKTADMEAYVEGLLKSYITKEEADETYQPAGDYPTTADMGTAISNATKDLAPKSSIPAKVSQLSNDREYLTPTTGDLRYAAKQTTENALTEQGNKIAKLEEALENATIEFAESVEWLEENGDTKKKYYLPDGYVYAWMQKTVEVEHNALSASGYALNARPSPSDTTSNNNGSGLLAVNAIPVNASTDSSSKINISWPTTDGSTKYLYKNYYQPLYVHFYGSAGTQLGYQSAYQLGVGANGESLALPATIDVSKSPNYANATAIRLMLGIKESGSITATDIEGLVVNCEWLDTTETVWGWYSTGQQHSNDKATQQNSADIAALKERMDDVEEALGSGAGGTGTAPLFSKLGLIGDSLTAQDYQGWQALTVSMLGNPEWHNNAIRGSCVANYDGTATDSFVSRYLNTPEDCDCIIIMGGTNDATKKSGNDMGAVGVLDTNTYKGAYSTIIEGLLTRNPATRVMLMTPPRSYTTSYEERTATKKYAEATVEIAKFYGLPCLDFYDTLGWNACTAPWCAWDFTGATGQVDTLHFSNDIGPRVGRMVANFIKTYY